MPRAASLALLLSAVLTGGCNTEYPNPFANASATLEPPPGTDILFVSNTYASATSVPREVFAVAADGSALTRLTFCNTGQARCDTTEAAAARDRSRIAVRRIPRDTDGDGRLTPADGEALLFVDLARAVEGALQPPTARVSGIDWSPTRDVIVYSAAGEGGTEDLFRVEPGNDPRSPSNPHNVLNLTSTPGIRERRPRIDPSGTVAVFERIDATLGATKGQIWIFDSSRVQLQVTRAGPGSEPLAETPYIVGSDADPDYSPDGRSIVFRRLTALGNGGVGFWDLLTVRTDGAGLSVLATGPAYRGAPDWGPQGIVFNEIDKAAGTSKLVIVQPDGSGRRTPATMSAHVDLSFPRWLR